LIAFGAQRPWSVVGQVSDSAGDVIMANPDEMHDGAPLAWIIHDFSGGKRKGALKD
jgi:hypothetical protein